MQQSDGLIIRKVRMHDIQAVLKISERFIEDYGEPEFPWDQASLRDIFMSLLSESPYFRLVLLDGLPVAWMAASNRSPHAYSYSKCLTQQFYHSTLEGKLAVRALRAAHADMFDFASKRGFNVVCSSSFLPNKATFYRILEKDGWRETPVGALKRISHG